MAMTIEVWITFVITASIILVIPGPTIIYVVGQSLNHGRKAGVPLAIGVISGDALCIFLSLLGVAAVLTLFSTAFLIIKYLGGAYLVYLGLRMLRANSAVGLEQEISSYSSKSIFQDVFLVNALNPKGIVFYSAFMPQFVNPQGNVHFQLGLLAVTFLFLALINVLIYSTLASKAGNLFRSQNFMKGFNLTGGLCLIGAGIYSATVEHK